MIEPRITKGSNRPLASLLFHRALVSMLSLFFISSLSLLLSFSFLPPASALGAPLCSEVMDPTWRDRIADYLHELHETYGLRLLLKDPPPPSSLPPLWGGFVSPRPLDAPHPEERASDKDRASDKTPPQEGSWARFHRHIHSALDFFPEQVGQTLWGNKDYRFTPFKGSFDLMVERPTLILTEKLLGRPLVPTDLVRFSLGFALSLLAYQLFETLFDNFIIPERVNNEVEANAALYKDLIAFDYRFDKIRRLQGEGKVTEKEAIQAAYLINMVYNQYYTYRLEHPSPQPLESEMSLLGHPLFVHLKKIIEEGILPGTLGFQIPESSLGPLPTGKILQLFETNHELFLEYQFIVEMLKMEERKQAPKSQFRTSLSFSYPSSEVFRKELQTLFDEKKLSRVQLQRLLQENAYWETKFKEWEIVGVTKLKSDGSNKPLLLTDVQKSLLRGHRKLEPSPQVLLSP